MPTPDDIDPVQDLKAAREAAREAVSTPPPPTLGDLYRDWLAANDEWAAANEKLKQAQAQADAAKARARNLEQQLGAAALDGVPRADAYRGRGQWVAMAGRLFFIDEVGNEHNGWRYEVRPQEVRKLAV